MQHWVIIRKLDSWEVECGPFDTYLMAALHRDGKEQFITKDEMFAECNGHAEKNRYGNAGVLSLLDQMVLTTCRNNKLLLQSHIERLR